jgi:uncharacterized repeat protein (TIGR03803 family)
VSSSVVAWLVLAPVARGELPITTLVSFDVVNGSQPSAALVQASDGNLYGTADQGGASNDGIFFRLSPDGSFSNLFSFSGAAGSYPGANPVAALWWGSNGMFYGTTSSGGNSNLGTIFRVSTNGVFTSLVSFTGTNGAALGAVPVAGLVQARDGNFYGTTQMGGTNDLAFDGDGTVFRLSPAGALTTLWSFDVATSGGNPYGTLVQGTNGNLYGTTQTGGSNGLGTLFEITTNGALTTLVSFGGTNGANPQTGLTLAKDGHFYGTTYFGGATNAGTAFRLTQAGSLSVLASFNNTNGANPYGDLLQANDGSFYGTTQTGGAHNYGTVFRLTTAGVISRLASFALTNGQYPVAGLAQGANGYLYGTTFWGGSNARGTIFRLPPPPTLVTWKLSAGSFTLGWTAATGQVYQAEFTTNLAPGGWKILGTTVTATNSIATTIDPSATNRQRFYRVQLLP